MCWGTSFLVKSEFLFHQFHHPYLIELNDVRVSNLFEDFDLSCDPLDVFLVLDFFFLKNLYSDLY